MAPDAPAEGGGAAPAQAAARSSGNRILLWAGAVIGVLLAAAAAVTYTRDVALDPETPEGVVQSYLSAVIDGRRGKARTYLSDRLRTEWTECVLESSYYLRDGSYRIEWLGTNIEGQTAYVDVRVTEERMLEPDSAHYRLFVLAYQEEGADGGSWRITRQDWPRRRCSEDFLPPPDPDAEEV